MTATASKTAVHVSGAEAPASTATGPFPATFVGISTGATGGRLAVHSAANGRVLKYLTAAEPGGGPGLPSLSADGTVIFQRGTGSCAATIDAVPAGGGPERVLIPMVGRGNQAIMPGLPSSSADGRYLSYLTARCSAPLDETVHLRNLHTGRELTGPGWVGPDAVFLDNDQQVVSVSGSVVAVLRVPSLTTRTYAAPRGCRYGSLAGTSTELLATLDCGARNALSVVAISPRTFAVTRTLIRLGTCLDASISAAAHDPSALLVETEGACLPPTTAPMVRILKIRGAEASVVLSGSASFMPIPAIW
ncbi:MAG TPA: hypothetical protein VIY52_28730 [Streptosporangiaceae bacterium]